MKALKLFLLLGVGILLFFGAQAWGAVPQLMNYQGILTDGSGNPIINTSRSVVFTIYNAPAGGTAIWAETLNVNTDGSGRFNVLLGEVHPVSDTVFAGTDRYLGLKVATDQELTPRTRLVSNGYSFRVATVDGATGGIISGDVDIQSDLSVSGNIELPTTTATIGIIKAGADRFIHNYGTYNTFVGVNAGNLTMTGGFNTGVGYWALKSNTTGNDNTACGLQALWLNTTGNGNTATGENALANNQSGGANTANGVDALYSNTTGNGNTANGYSALVANSTGISNTATGHSALLSNSTGNYNTANGYQALLFNTTGALNTANGYHALSFNTTGNENTANGSNALYSNTTGALNTANGSNALYSNTTGYDNTANGWGALQSNTTGNSNTANGRYALLSNSTGTNNTAIGYLANVATGGLTNATAIGANALVAASNAMVLGGTGANAVNVGIGTTSPQGALDVSSTTGALIVPRMTTAQRDALTAVNGMIIYNTSTDQFNFREAGAWVTK